MQTDSWPVVHGEYCADDLVLLLVDEQGREPENLGVPIRAGCDVAHRNPKMVNPTELWATDWRAAGSVDRGAGRRLRRAGVCAHRTKVMPGPGGNTGPAAPAPRNTTGTAPATC
jgi:hypothetical protein